MHGNLCQTFFGVSISCQNLQQLKEDKLTVRFKHVLPNLHVEVVMRKDGMHWRFFHVGASSDGVNRENWCCIDWICDGWTLHARDDWSIYVTSTWLMASNETILKLIIQLLTSAYCLVLRNSIWEQIVVSTNIVLPVEEILKERNDRKKEPGLLNESFMCDLEFSTNKARKFGNENESINMCIPWSHLCYQNPSHILETVLLMTSTCKILLYSAQI